MFCFNDGRLGHNKELCPMDAKKEETKSSRPLALLTRIQKKDSQNRGHKPQQQTSKIPECQHTHLYPRRAFKENMEA